MQTSFKSRVRYDTKLSDMYKGLFCFWTHPQDRVVFLTKLSDLLKTDKKQDLLLTVSRYYPPRSSKQNRLYWKIVRQMCIDENSQAYGSDPENLHEGILARAAMSYGYPTITVAGVCVPERSHKTLTKHFNILLETARVIAGEIGADLSEIHLDEESDDTKSV